MNPTNEQILCIEAFKTGNNVAIEAGAGTGKTSTLIQIAKSMPHQRGQYVAFNKAIVMDAASKMPSSVRANTMHSLAFKTVGAKFQRRFQSGRMSSSELAQRLGTQSITMETAGGKRMLHFGYLASLAMQAVTNFCRSADQDLKRSHVPYIDGIDMPDEKGDRTYANNDAVREALLEPMQKAWKDLSDPRGQLPYKHDCYLKTFELGDPKIHTDFLLYDEAQDADPVQLSIISKQKCQKIYVGDSQQELYAWRGASNALSNLGTENTRYLTQSFRFGNSIAEIANTVLGWIGAPLRLKGLPSLSGYVGKDVKPDAVLCRTNAGAIRAVLSMQQDGRRTCLLGGAKDMLSFTRAVVELQTRGNTYHPELACFSSWDNVQDYVDHDPQGSELALLVKLVDEFGTDTIISALSNTDNEGPGVVTVSTVHKSKGRQWPAVRLGNDFGQSDPEKTTDDLSVAELRLRYVAVTRAQFELDCTSIPEFDQSK